MMQEKPNYSAVKQVPGDFIGGCEQLTAAQLKENALLLSAYKFRDETINNVIMCWTLKAIGWKIMRNKFVQTEEHMFSLIDMDN